MQRLLVCLVLQSTEPSHSAASVAALIAARKALLSSAGSTGPRSGSQVQAGGG